MVATIKLKFKHVTSRKKKLGNGDSALININEMGYHSQGTNFLQTKFSKFNFPVFEGENPSG